MVRGFLLIHFLKVDYKLPKSRSHILSVQNMSEFYLDPSLFSYFNPFMTEVVII